MFLRHLTEKETFKYCPIFLFSCLDKNCWILAAVCAGARVGVHETRDGGGVGEGGVVEELLPPAGVMGTQQKPGSNKTKDYE